MKFYFLLVSIAIYACKPKASSNLAKTSGESQGELAIYEAYFTEESDYFIRSLGSENPAIVEAALGYFKAFPLKYGTIRSSGLAGAIGKIANLKQHSLSVAEVLGLYCLPKNQSCDAAQLLPLIKANLTKKMNEWLSKRITGNASYHVEGRLGKLTENDHWSEATFIQMAFDSKVFDETDVASAKRWYEHLLKNFPKEWNRDISLVEVLSRIVVIHRFAHQLILKNEREIGVYWPMVYDPIVERVYPVFWQIFDYLIKNQQAFNDLKASMSYPCGDKMCAIIDGDNVEEMLLWQLMDFSLKRPLKIDDFKYTPDQTARVYQDRWADLLASEICGTRKISELDIKKCGSSSGSEDDRVQGGSKSKFLDIVLLASRKSNLYQGARNHGMELILPSAGSMAKFMNIEEERQAYHKTHYKLMELIEAEDLGQCNVFKDVKFMRHCPVLGSFLKPLLSPYISAQAISGGDADVLGIGYTLSSIEHLVVHLRHPLKSAFADKSYNAFKGRLSFEENFLKNEGLTARVICHAYDSNFEKGGFLPEFVARSAYVFARYYHLSGQFKDAKSFGDFQEAISKGWDDIECPGRDPSWNVGFDNWSRIPYKIVSSLTINPRGIVPRIGDVLEGPPSGIAERYSSFNRLEE